MRGKGGFYFGKRVALFRLGKLTSTLDRARLGEKDADIV